MTAGQLHLGQALITMENGKHYIIKLKSHLKSLFYRSIKIIASISIDNEYFNDKFIFAYVTLNDIMVSEKIKYLAPLKNLKLTQPKFQYEVDIVDNFYEIKLISKNLIKNLFIASMLEYNFSDHYFDLIPNKEKVIRINRDNFTSARSFEESLRFISLYDTY